VSKNQQHVLFKRHQQQGPSPGTIQEDCSAGACAPATLASWPHAQCIACTAHPPGTTPAASIQPPVGCPVLPYQRPGAHASGPHRSTPCHWSSPCSGPHPTCTAASNWSFKQVAVAVQRGASGCSCKSSLQEGGACSCPGLLRVQTQGRVLPCWQHTWTSPGTTMAHAASPALLIPLRSPHQPQAATCPAFPSKEHRHVPDPVNQNQLTPSPTACIQPAVQPAAHHTPHLRCAWPVCTCVCVVSAPKKDALGRASPLQNCHQTRSPV
jgi:hypothetical protein